MDKTQIATFADFLVGWSPVGVAGQEEIAVPVSPLLRAFIIARLGDDAPRSGYEAMNNRHKAEALARLLREVADGLDLP